LVDEGRRIPAFEGIFWVLKRKERLAQNEVTLLIVK